MSESREGGTGVRPAVWRRRRLMLASRPWVTSGHDGSKAEVRSLLCADPVREDVGAADLGAEDTSRAEASSVRSSVGSSSAHSRRLAAAGNGSRLWALTDDDGSSEEEALTTGESSDVREPPAPAGNGSPTKREVLPNWPAVGGSREIYCRARGRTGRSLEVHPKMVRQHRPACKPWRGPIP
jgi:hypothetical protein